jgi:type II secretory ATPase GspE/PulE/Tfp pilus assembly ATPase PilB-like protein
MGSAAGTVRLVSEAGAGPAASPAKAPQAGEINIIEEFNGIVDDAVDRRASDIHLEAEDDRFRVRYRIDGNLLEARAYPPDTAAAMVSRIKVLANPDIT